MNDQVRASSKRLRRAVAEVETEVPGLLLRTLRPEDAERYVEVLRSSTAHLTRLGDYLDEVRLGVPETAATFGLGDLTRFGVWLDDSLIGCVHLVGVAPPSFGFGFWIEPEHEGLGLMYAACHAALRWAIDRLDAEDVFAGVTHGNVRSEALLGRLGFDPISSFETYTRFHLTLAALAITGSRTDQPGRDPLR